MLHTNPVLVRQMMAALRDAGYVTARDGLGGGWTLTCDLEDLTLKEIHDAITNASQFAIGPAADNPVCPVESAVNHFVAASIDSAETNLLQCFADKLLSELVSDVQIIQESRANQNSMAGRGRDCDYASAEGCM